MNQLLPCIPLHRSTCDRTSRFPVHHGTKSDTVRQETMHHGQTRGTEFSPQEIFRSLSVHLSDYDIIPDTRTLQPERITSLHVSRPLRPVQMLRFLQPTMLLDISLLVLLVFPRLVSLRLSARQQIPTQFQPIHVAMLHPPVERHVRIHHRREVQRQRRSLQLSLLIQ